mmetsp:Transcript_36277/g.71885  ORF Transcript_36277/g.71885 Transcript_36277/m.71885 type:complete len:296 (-) Transcript_36277:316-1203(-)
MGTKGVLAHETHHRPRASHHPQRRRAKWPRLSLKTFRSRLATARRVVLNAASRCPWTPRPSTSTWPVSAPRSDGPASHRPKRKRPRSRLEWETSSVPLLWATPATLLQRVANQVWRKQGPTSWRRNPKHRRRRRRLASCAGLASQQEVRLQRRKCPGSKPASTGHCRRRCPSSSETTWGTRKQRYRWPEWPRRRRRHQHRHHLPLRPSQRHRCRRRETKAREEGEGGGTTTAPAQDWSRRQTRSPQTRPRDREALSLSPPRSLWGQSTLLALALAGLALVLASSGCERPSPPLDR